jgi:hypothetical protein
MGIATSRSFDITVASYLGVEIAPGFMQRQNPSFAELFRPGKLVETGGIELFARRRSSPYWACHA